MYKMMYPRRGELAVAEGSVGGVGGNFQDQGHIQ